MSSRALHIGMPYGAYPERDHPRLGWIERLVQGVVGLVVARKQARSRSWRRFVRLVGTEGHSLEASSDEQLRACARELQVAFRAYGFQEKLVARSFALVREVASRTLGHRHFDVQLIGGKILLDGRVAEMETGEGKTLTATLAA